MRYSDQERAEHVLMLEAAGYPKKKGALWQYSKQSGIPHPTLSRWFRKVSNPPPDEIVQIKKRDMKEALRELIFDLVEHAHDAANDAGLDSLTRGVGIAVDKLLLLDDKPNAIVKLQQAIDNGLVKPEQVRERWPRLAEQFFADVDR
jgi:hypothetical protein